MMRERLTRHAPISSWSWSPASPSPSTATITISPSGPVETLRTILQGHPTCPPERHYPPRLETLQRVGPPPRRPGDTQGHRFRGGQGHRAASDRADHLHSIWPDHRDVRVHVSRAGGDEPTGG